MKKKAFSLAEFLVTLLIIGVAAILVLPTFYTQLTAIINEKRQTTFEHKLKEALGRMRTKSLLNQIYPTTQDFIDNLKSQIQIAQICSSENLTDCFPDIIKESANSIKYQTSTLTNANKFNAGFSSNVVGVRFADGVSALIAYNPACIVMDEFDTEADVFACLAMIYDTNGNSNPNIISQDQATINLWADESEIEIMEIFSPEALSKENCTTAYAQGVPMKYLCEVDSDYWAGATKKCHDDGYRLPTRKELSQLAQQLYGATEGTGLSIKDTDLRVKLIPTNATVAYWSSEEQGARYAFARAFASTGTAEDYQFINTAGMQEWFTKGTSSRIKGMCVK